MSPKRQAWSKRFFLPVGDWVFMLAGAAADDCIFNPPISLATRRRF
jgi:hypothetical protein